MRFAPLACAFSLLLLSTLPARACWDAPTAYCFSNLWQDKALSYGADGPTPNHLYNLLDWGLVPPGPEAARTLLAPITYDALVAHHANDTPSNLHRPDGQGEPSVEEALLLMLGYLDAPTAHPVPPYYLSLIYELALRTEDPSLAQTWYDTLPNDLRNSPGLVSPDGTQRFPDPYAEGQAHTIVTLTHLQAGEVEPALSSASKATGEPAFLAWRGIARHAITAQDVTLLSKAIAGMKAALIPPDDVNFDDAAFEAALALAEEEFRATGDPDAIVGVYEGFDPSTYLLPTGAQITVALAHRYLLQQTGQTGDDGFDAVLAAMAEVLASGEDEDDATPMLNARTALRLGLTEEADQLIALTETHFSGIAGFFLHDLPPDSPPWANAWLDRMIARFDAIIADPAAFETRTYWDIWLEQDALGAAIDITVQLAKYNRLDEARSFAQRAEAYLSTLPDTFPDPNGLTLTDVFTAETAAFLLPPDDALTAIRAAGHTTTRVLYAFRDAGHYDMVLNVLQNEPGLRNLEFWLRALPELRPQDHETYATSLAQMIEEEANRLRIAGYPTLVQTLYAEAALFHARLGQWEAARRAYTQIQDATGEYGTIPAIQNQLSILRQIANHLAGPQATPVQYPFADFAL